jgi:hypothetical protein
MSFQELLTRWLPPKTRPGAERWAAPRVLDRGRVGRPQIAMDEHGHALAAWHHRGQDQEGVYICWFHADRGAWDLVPRRLDSARTEARAPELAMNVRGEVAVVWHEREGEVTRVCARHMLGAAETWVPYPLTLHAAPGEVVSLHAAMDDQGGIQTVWCHGRGGSYRVFACGYDPDAGAWDAAPTPLGQDFAEPVYPQLALTRSGHGLVVWSEGRRSEGRLVACHYDPSGRCWSDRPTPVAPSAAGYIRLALDPRGGAIALWVAEGDGGLQALHASHFDPHSLEWRAGPVLASGRSILWPLVGLDDQGGAHALWRQEVAGAKKLFTKRFAGGHWDEHRFPLVEDLGQSEAHALMVNAAGQALAVWCQNQGAQASVCVRRFDGQAWSARPLLLGAPGREARDPAAALTAAGHVAVVWRQGGETDGLILTAVGET